MWYRSGSKMSDLELSDSPPISRLSLREASRDRTPAQARPDFTEAGVNKSLPK